MNKVAKKYDAKFIETAQRGLSHEETKVLVREVLRENSTDEDPMEEPFFVADFGILEEQMRQWIEYLPRVRPFYAYKCNGSQVILDTVSALGAGFDCASAAEFEHVLEMGLDAGKDIIFANPCKQISHIKAAARCGMKYVTFDNEYELPKIKKHWPDAKVVLRVVTDDSKSICEFSSKYGAALNYCPKLIETCKELDLELVGVSFHVGSGCGDAGAFVQATRDARKVFDMAIAKGFTMTLLDIGGGFPGDKFTTPTFKEISTELAPVIDELFDENVEVIAEPGRYFACASHSLAANVFSKRVIELPGSTLETETQYYLNEGVYQSFNCLFFDHAVVEPVPFHVDPALEDSSEDSRLQTTIFGPTCDGLDCIAKRILFPEMQLGDWMLFYDFGAYTMSAASKFNGFSTKKVVFTRTGISN